MDDALRSLGITTPQYAALSAVERRAGLTNADLARAAFVTAQSMQGILANLERDGLIERQAAPENRRLLGCSLSVAGRALVARAHAAVLPVEQTFVASFGQEDVDRIADLLISCAEKLDAVRAAPGNRP